MPRQKWGRAAWREALRLARLGWSDKAIAERLKITPQTLGNWQRSKPKFGAAMKEAKRPVRCAKLLLNAQGISPNSERGRKLIELAWKIWREDQRKPPEERADAQQQGISAEELLEIDAEFSALRNDPQIWESLWSGLESKNTSGTDNGSDQKVTNTD